MNNPDQENLKPPEKIIDLTTLSPKDILRLLEETVEQTLQQKAGAISLSAGLSTRPGKPSQQTTETLLRAAASNAKMVRGLRYALGHPGAVTIKSVYNYPGRNPQEIDKQYDSPLLQPMDIIDLEKMAPKPE